jgi:hypothetical protein
MQLNRITTVETRFPSTPTTQRKADEGLSLDSKIKCNF